jgi:hypothetical protein
MLALKHAADFLAEQAQEADGKQVHAHTVAPDGVFTVCGTVFGRWLAVVQEEVDASERGNDDDTCLVGIGVWIRSSLKAMFCCA